MGSSCWMIGGVLLLLLLAANWAGVIGFIRYQRRHPESKRGYSFAPPFLGDSQAWWRA